MGEELTTKEEILLALSISMGALFLATLATLIIARYSKKIHEFCLTHLPCCKEELEKDDMNENLLNKAEGKIPLMLSGKDENMFVIPGAMYFEKIQPNTTKLVLRKEGENVEKRDDASTKIKPDDGTSEDSPKRAHRSIFSNFRSKSIDVAPTHYSRTRSLSSSGGSGHTDFAARSTISLNEQLYKSDRRKRGSYFMADINPFTLRRNALSNSDGNLIKGSQNSQILADYQSRFQNISSDASAESEEQEDSVHSLQAPGFTRMGSSPRESDEDADKLSSLQELRPELYDTSRKRSVGIGMLGKIKISLQYIDKDKTKLELFIHGMDLLILRATDTGLYTTVVLLPERECVYKSKVEQAKKNPTFEESFVFQKSHPTDDFETKTIRFSIYTLKGQEKSCIYGESNISLARSEIFGQIKTSNVLNIHPQSSTSEVGDILLEILYTKSDMLQVIVRMLKMASTTSLDCMSALQVKLSIKKRRRKVGKTLTVLCPLRNEKDSYVPVNSEKKQTVPRENFLQYSLHITVSGKHKVLGTSTKMGRTILGESVLRETESLHWSTIFNSPGTQYNLWHVLYST